MKSWLEDATQVGNESFEKQTPELQIALSELPTLTIPEAVSVMKTRAESTPEGIQVFGAKLPLSNTLLVFGLLILSCQFYLWAHVNELRRLMLATPGASRPTGFIGFYPGAITATVVGLTLTVLPLAAMLYVLLRSIPVWLWRDLPRTDMIAVLAVALSSAIGARTIWLMRSIRNPPLASDQIAVEEERPADADSAKASTNRV